MLESVHSASLFEPFRTAGITGLQAFTDADAAVARIATIYDKGVAILRDAFERFTAGETAEQLGALEAYYPFVGIQVDRQSLNLDARRSFGALHDPGVYGSTLTRPALFRDYDRRQLGLLLEHHGVPVVVGISNRRMPLPFVIQESTADLRPDRVAALQAAFPLPDMSLIDDAIANGTLRSAPGELKPLALFTADRVDYSLERLDHYTATSPEHVQRFILLTNYQRYVEHFIDYARREIEGLQIPHPRYCNFHQRPIRRAH
jgi:AMP nucleosidase